MKDKIPDSDFEVLLDEATLGLRDDPELRLDVRTELRSHIEDAVAETALRGDPQDACLSQAIEAFGSGEAVAENLVTANRHRMRYRAWARAGMRYVVIPAAVALTVIVGVRMFARTHLVVYGFRALAEVHPRQEEGRFWKNLDIPWWRYSDPIERLPEELAVFLRKDSGAEHFRSAWVRQPDNRAFYGRYVDALLSGPGRKDTAYIEAEIRRGMRVDPDNALYPYLLAHCLASESCRVEPGPDGGTEFEIVDEDGMQRAMAELLKGHARPTFRRYRQEVVAKTLKLMPRALNLEDLAVHARLVAGEQHLDSRFLRDLAVMAWAYAGHKVEMDRPNEARRLLSSWRHLARKLSADAFTFADLLVVRAIAADVGQNVGPAYDALSLASLGSRQVAQAEEIRETIDNEMRFATRSGELAFVRDIEQSGSIFAKIASPLVRVRMPPRLPNAPRAMRDPEPLFGTPRVAPASAVASDPRVLSNLRWAEHVFIEQLAVSAATLMFIGMIASMGLLALRWRRGHGSGATFVLLPRLLDLVQLLGVCVVLPMAVYYVYTRWTGHSGREYGFSFLWQRFVLELALVAVVITSLFERVAWQMMRRRCRELGMRVPPRPGRYRMTITAGMVAVFCVICLRLRGDAENMFIAHLPYLAGGAALIWIVDGLWRFVGRLLAPSRFGLYYHVAARSLIPLYAAAVMIFGMLVFPLLDLQEKAFLREERVFERLATEGYVNMEYRSLLNLKREIEQTLKRGGV